MHQLTIDELFEVSKLVSIRLGYLSAIKCPVNKSDHDREVELLRSTNHKVTLAIDEANAAKAQTDLDDFLSRCLGA